MTLLGHSEAWAAWRRARDGVRMHHAWLLSGRQGLGKASFAHAAARELVGASGEDHPDIHVLTYAAKDDKEDKKRLDGKPFEKARSIRIAQIRAMQQRLVTRPTAGDWRAVIIDPADDLERNAANALLKSLEEPPEGTIFLLVSHRPAQLLPTIRSRCRVLRFPPVSADALHRQLERNAPDADAPARAAAIAAAAGSPGAALSYLQLDLGKVARLMQSILEEGDRGFARRAALAELIGARPDRDRMSAMLDMARQSLAQHLAGVVHHPGPVIDAHEQLVRLTGEHATFNYDAGLLAMEIGTLLVKAAEASDRADA